LELSITYTKDAKALKQADGKRLFDRQSLPERRGDGRFACGLDFAVMVSNLVDQRFGKTNSSSLTRRVMGFAVSAEAGLAEERL
jgi:hypothetical protein